MSNVKKNIALLLLVQISNYIFPLISLPYLMHTLGAEEFGVIAISQAVIQYCIIFSDYGFNLSATRRLAIATGKDSLSRIFISTFLAKLILVIACGVILFTLLPFMQGKQYNFAAMMIFFVSVFGNLLFPIYLYQAMELMAKIVWITIFAKFLSLLSVFFLVKGKEDVIGAAVSLSLGLTLSGVISIIYIWKAKLISYVRINMSDVRSAFSDGFPLFLSSMAISFYTTFNVLFAGHHFSIDTVGNYSAADKLRMAVQSLFNPVQQVIFPRVNKIYNSTGKLSDTILKYSIILIFFGAILSVFIWLFGKYFSFFYFGKDFLFASDLFVKMSPLFIIIAFSIVLGQWGLIVLGKSKALSKIYIVGALCHLAYIYPMVECFSINGLVYSVIMTESIICLMMAFCLVTFSRSKRNK